MSGGIGQSSLNKNTISSKPPVISNPVTAIAGTEKIVNIPKGTTQFELKVKEGNSSIEIAMTSGGVTYKVDPGDSFRWDKILSNGMDLYIICNKNTVTLQLILWS